ncbi:MAG: branched-chain amino acid aminotransferase [Rickettsiales bacterium]|nr:branched-chain amino acid aminotransferase [Rickettsiales bacterium]
MTTLSPFDDRDGFIWYDGQLVPWRDAKVHVLNHGLHYASSVFEGVRVYNGKIFKNTEHNERLHASAQLLGFEIPYSVSELNQVCKDVIKAQNIENGYIRPIAWRGSEQMAILTNRSTTHVAVAAWEWPSYFGDEAKQKGLRLTFAQWKRPSPETEPTASKAAGLYMICTLSKNKAVDDGFEDALMLDWRGYIAEATGANIFLIINGELHTPLPDCFLDGITRRTVIGLAKARGFEVHERHILPEELAKADQAFLTGTAAEVTPIQSINGELGDYSFTVGDITRQLMDDYTALVNS